MVSLMVNIYRIPEINDFYQRNMPEKVAARSSALSGYADFQGVSQLRMYRLCEQPVGRNIEQN
jgi:hypothetical protein